MVKNIAHRGYSARYPENTMLAFRQAALSGCDGIELDVHLSADNQVVIIHDEELDRTTNGHGYVKDYTLAQLQQLDAGCGERIPTLEEFFDWITPLSLMTNIELKNSIFWYEGMEEKIIEMVRKRGLEDRVIFSSYNHYSMLACKRLAPEIPCGVLIWSWLIGAGEYAKRHGMEYIHPEFNSLNELTMEDIKRNGCQINAYTADREEDLLRLISLQIAGIITNDPAALHALLKQKNSV